MGNGSAAVYADDEGFMRGARIAEKIYEFNHTSGSNGLVNNTGTASNSKLMIFNKPMTAG